MSAGDAHMKNIGLPKGVAATLAVLRAPQHAAGRLRPIKDNPEAWRTL